VLAAALVATALAAAPPPARVERIATGFDQPVYVTGVPGRPRALAVVERYGRVRLLRPGRPGRRPVLVDVRSRVGIDDPRETVDQRGLLSAAFGRGGRIYLDYVDRDGRLRVDEWRRGRLRPLLDLGVATTQHHGGQLAFGPDGLLYVSTGMGSDPEVSQDPAAPGGKILRFDPLAAAPRPEVVALGLRNPWRFSFHRGALLIGDVGEDRAEEVDVVPRGATLPVNFGWPFREGRATLRDGAPPGLTGPALVHRHGRGWCSLVGGYVQRGRYVYGDVCSGHLWSARYERGRLARPRRLGPAVGYLVSFGRDARGRLYAVSLGGSVHRLR
jgi:glucose/arabinose dehydrogenase